MPHLKRRTRITSLRQVVDNMYSIIVSSCGTDRSAVDCQFIRRFHVGLEKKMRRDFDDDTQRDRRTDG